MVVSRSLGVCAALALMASGAIAQGRGEWIFLGQTKVQPYGAKEVILAAPKGDVSAIQLRVENAAIDIWQIEIHFMSGLTTKMKVKEFVQPGGQTSVIEFKGRRAVVRSVEISYAKTKWGRERPVVSLFARR